MVIQKIWSGINTFYWDSVADFSLNNDLYIFEEIITLITFLFLLFLLLRFKIFKNNQPTVRCVSYKSFLS